MRGGFPPVFPSLRTRLRQEGQAHAGAGSPVAEDTEKVAFNKRKTYKAIREGQLLPTDSVPGLPGTTAGELLVRNLRLQYVSRLRRSKAKKGRLDSGDSSSSS
eukprot:tig00021251_g19646.t1